MIFLHVLRLKLGEFDYLLHFLKFGRFFWYLGNITPYFFGFKQKNPFFYSQTLGTLALIHFLHNWRVGDGSLECLF